MINQQIWQDVPADEVRENSLIVATYSDGTKLEGVARIRPGNELFVNVGMLGFKDVLVYSPNEVDDDQAIRIEHFTVIGEPLPTEKGSVIIIDEAYGYSVPGTPAFLGFEWFWITSFGEYSPWDIKSWHPAKIVPVE